MELLHAVFPQGVHEFLLFAVARVDIGHGIVGTERDVFAVLGAIGHLEHAPVRAGSGLVVRILDDFAKLEPFRPVARPHVEDENFHVARVGQVTTRLVAEIFVVGVDQGVYRFQQLAVGDAVAFEFSIEGGILIDELVVLFPFRKVVVPGKEQGARLA